MKDHDELIGVWKLLSFDIEYKESGRREPFYGDAIPGGYIIFTPEARMMALMATSGCRTPSIRSAEVLVHALPSSDQNEREAHRGLLP